MKKKNFDKQYRTADNMLSARWQRELNDLYLTRGRDKAVIQNFERQQQEAFGFSNIGGGISVPAAVTWLSQAWDSSATYPAGVGGQPVAGSFVQLNGVVYAIPGSSASTPGTPPPGGVWVIQSPGPGMNGWQVNPNARQSVWANPTLDFPLPPVATDVVDSAWYWPDLQVISTTANAFYYPSPGRMLLVGTFVTNFPLLQLNINGTFTTLFTTIASTFQWIELDGLSWIIKNPATSTRQTYTLYRIRQSMQ